jgi:hypothetical protein
MPSDCTCAANATLVHGTRCARFESEVSMRKMLRSFAGFVVTTAVLAYVRRLSRSRTMTLKVRELQEKLRGLDPPREQTGR